MNIWISRIKEGKHNPSIFWEPKNSSHILEKLGRPIKIGGPLRKYDDNWWVPNEISITLYNTYCKKPRQKKSCESKASVQTMESYDAYSNIPWMVVENFSNYSLTLLGGGVRGME